MEQAMKDLTEQLKEATRQLSNTNNQNTYFEDESDIDAKINLSFDVTNKTKRGVYKVNGNIPVSFTRTFEAHKTEVDKLLEKTNAHKGQQDKQDSTSSLDKTGSTQASQKA